MDNDLFRLKLYPAEELKKLAGYILKLKSSKSARPGSLICHSERSASGAKNLTKRAGSKLLSEVKKSLAWRYGFGDAQIQPAKQSVTALTHHSDEYVKIDYSRALERQPKIVCVDETESAKEVEGRLIGTATHLVISRLDLTGPITVEAVEQIKEKLLADSAISKLVAGHIDTQSILNFFQSELGQAVIEAENTVWREWPFTYAMPVVARASSPWSTARMAVPLSTGDEIIVVQGIIDMLVQTPKGLLVIDFKTDRITAGEVAERTELYRKQLELYGRATGAILKAKILAKWLYFLTPATAFEIK